MACYTGKTAPFIDFVAKKMRLKGAQTWSVEDQVQLVVECFMARRWEGMLVNEQEEDLFFELIRKKALAAARKAGRA